MSESGKRFALMTALKTLEQYFWVEEQHLEVTLLTVGDEETEVVWPDFRHLAEQVSGSFRLKGRLEHPAVEAADKLLIFSDGCWRLEDRRAFEKLGRLKGEDFARVVIIGAEADRKCKEPHFVLAEDLLGLLERWISC